MDSLKELLIPKRFSVYGYIVAVFTVLAGGITTFVTGIKASEIEQFQCDSHGIPADKDFLTTKCFNQYRQVHNASLPLYGFVFITFASLVLICIIYSWCCVKSRVEQIQQECLENQDNPRPATVRTRLIFMSYLLQLLVRFGFGVFFALLQLTGLYASNFPPQFQCKSNSKGTNFNASSSIITCQNSFAEEKTLWAKVIWILHIVFACLVLFEVFYLLTRACHDKGFMRDSEFCQSHLYNNRRVSLSQRDFSLLMSGILEQTKYLELLMPEDPSEDDNRRAIDDVYVELVILSGRVTHDFDMAKKRHELLNVYLKPPTASVQINNIRELFVSETQPYRNILIIGRPGIGKTSLCTKIIRDWCKDKMNQFKFVFLFRFRHLNSERFDKISLMRFLNEAEHSMNIDSATLQNITDETQSILFIFDGFDEFKHRKNLMKDQSEFSGLNGLSDEMPVTALYSKLLQKKLLPGATILTTSRPNAVDTLKTLKVQFDRVAEILGFTPEKVRSYVHKFCNNNEDTARKIWQHIESNVNLLYLCYIPVTCWIVCSLLHNFIEKHNSMDTLALPTTLSDIYKGALRLFLFNHNPEYQQQASFNDYTNDTFSSTIEEALSKLGKLARKGIEEKRLVFEEEEVQGLENCGLLNCMPSNENPAFGFARASQYCFIHLTLQEFLAAREIAKVDDLNEVFQLTKNKAADANWHLVLQFIAGLLQKHAFEVSKFFEGILCHALTETYDRQLSLLMLKCIYELNNEEAAVRTAAKLESCKEFGGSIDFHEMDVTPPDCTAIVYVLRHCVTHLESLDISHNNFGDQGCSELIKIFTRDASNASRNYSSQDCHLNKMDLTGNKITDQGVLQLCDALKRHNCHLTQLGLSSNEITDKGLLQLSVAFKSENCHITHLDLLNNDISDQGVLYLSDALESENCHLTHLNLLSNQITDRGVFHICQALKSDNCLLSRLDVFLIEVTDQGILLLSDAIQCENCHLTQLTLIYNKISDQGVLHLSKALKSENCHLTNLNLSSNSITDQGLLHLSDALKCKNCHLTMMTLSYNKITDQGVAHLSDALKNENCHLIQLDLSFNEVTDQGLLQLSDALKCEMCDLTDLNLMDNQLTDQCVFYLEDALKSSTCHLRQFNLSRNQLTDEGVALLKAATECKDCLLIT